jgi:hypothetical protein
VSWVEPLVPEVSVVTTIEDLRVGRDPGLAAALAVLAGS